MKHAKFIFYLNFLRGLRWILCSSDYCVIFCGVWVSLVCFAKFINVDFLHCSEVCLVCLCPQPLAHLLPFLYKVLATFCSLELSVFSEDSASRMLVTTSYLLTPASSVASLGRPSQVGKGLSASFLSFFVSSSGCFSCPYSTYQHFWSSCSFVHMLILYLFSIQCLRSEIMPGLPYPLMAESWIPPRPSQISLNTCEWNGGICTVKIMCFKIVRYTRDLIHYLATYVLACGE